MITLNNTSLFRSEAYINGKWKAAQNGQQLEVHNPFDQTVVGCVPDMGVEDCRQAIEAAHNAFGQWKNFSAAKRAKILKRWHQLQLEHVDDLATILTIEQLVSVMYRSK